MNDTMLHLPRLMLAAPMSGSGKTTITAGLIAALAAHGHKIAPFKCGPDYIDPSYHTLAAGRDCTNLDSWLTPPRYIPALLAQRAAGTDLALIEGVMGLYDGYAQGAALEDEADAGSSAHIARLTNTPVIIVLDARGMARTAAALVAGLSAFDPRLNIAGVILNRVGSARHAKIITDAIETHVNIPVLGHLLREHALALPERHLGLVPTSEDGAWQDWLAQLRDQITATLDLDQLLTIAASAPPLPAPASSLPIFPPRPDSEMPPTIAVARDAAFSFRYADNLDLLAKAGAEIAYFSPLHDATLPPTTQGIYLCGGFPELYASILSGNHTMLASIRAAAQAGLPIYAECGGLIYLTEAVVNAEGDSYPLVGLLHGRATMTPRVTLGYRTVQACADSWLWHEGERIRGHEFHYSVWQGEPRTSSWLYEIQPTLYQPHAKNEGAHLGNVLASYIHLHFFAKPELATRFVATASHAPQFATLKTLP